MNDIRTLLLTTDFSETSKRAIAAALTLARRFEARIVVCFVEEDRLPPMVVEYMAVGVDELLNQQRARADERLEEFAVKHLPEDLSVKTVVAMGVPHVEIVRIAEEEQADLIVMATHGRGFITHAIMGSTAERVLRRSTLPVLVVRDPDAS